MYVLKYVLTYSIKMQITSTKNVIFHQYVRLLFIIYTNYWMDGRVAFKSGLAGFFFMYTGLHVRKVKWTITLFIVINEPKVRATSVKL